MDKEAQINECVYYQWDTLQQRLHVIQKRPPSLTKTIPPNGYESLIYIAYTINARGQFDSLVSIILIGRIFELYVIVDESSLRFETTE